MVEADPDDLAVLPVGIVDPGEFLAFPRTEGEPQVTKFGYEGPWDVFEMPVGCEVRDDPVRDGPGGHQYGDQC